MVGELSEDGQYMWDGNGWIPKPSSAEILPPSAVDQTQVMEVASQIGVNADSLANAAPYFDQNRDGQLQRSELEQAAVAIANPPPAGSRGGNGSPSSLKINNDNYYYSNSIARASKTMLECKNAKTNLKSTGTEG